MKSWYVLSLARLILISSFIQEFQKQRRNRPIFTGGFIRPTLNHVPLPRMKPQPPAISGMIVKRIIARRRRQERMAQFQSDLEDLTLEERFEDSLRKIEKAYVPTTFSGTTTALNEWSTQHPFYHPKIYLTPIQNNLFSKAFRISPNPILLISRELQHHTDRSLLLPSLKLVDGKYATRPEKKTESDVARS